MDIRVIKLLINNNKAIPQIGDEIWVKQDEKRMECIVLSIESVERDKRNKLKIKYKVKITDEKENQKGIYLIK